MPMRKSCLSIGFWFLQYLLSSINVSVSNFLNKRRFFYKIFSFCLPSRGLVEAGVAYLSLIAIGVSSRERSSTFIAMWIVLTSLLKRPHNLILTWIHLLQYSLISPHLTKQLHPFYTNLAHYWIGMTWYFQEVSQMLNYLR